ncbi:thioredoxin [Candidatus Aerophobetes bacterium]|uniref:Thioredoxin n=1 Tax=Aerophobetes bacterium TaxID=2030807 RepID=A0A497E5Y8_UNCAE|nr:MAG: thioredoxin [Candidatus Aerophobetes bacterium]
MAEITLNESNWEEEVIKSDIPVMVDFWAEWCMPCRMVSPIVEKISNEYEERIKVGKLNVDENPSIATRYRIMAIPAVLFFKNGDLVDQVVGAVPKRVLEEKVKKVLNE